jgi:ribulose-phosphate 3-epimerase
MAELAPSILSADFWRLGEDVRAVESAGAHWLHVDVMDGHFVPNITIGPLVVSALRRNTRLPLDVHLMIEEADSYIPHFAEAGADHITVHVEACRHLHRTLQLVRQQGERLGRRIGAGISLNPTTALASADEALAYADLVLLMSVNPGFGGQEFIAGSLDRARRVRRRIDELGLDVRIEMDGGIGLQNVAQVLDAGVDMVVAGSAVFDGKDPAARCTELLGAMRARPGLQPGPAGASGR